MPNWLVFILGLGTGIGLISLLCCVIMNIKEGKKK